MRQNLPYALALALLLVALGFFGLSRRGGEGQPVSTVEAARSEFFPLSLDGGPKLGLAEALAERPPAPNDAIADELLAVFASADQLGAFLSAARSAGLEIVDSDERLGAARVRTRNVDESRLARTLAGSEAAIEYNRTVLTPWPVNPETVELGPAFGPRALEYLGVPRDNADWGKGVKIAILDTGVLPHLSLIDVPIERVDLVDRSGPPTSIASHGTAVASLLVGQGGVGIVPAAELISIRVLDSDGIGDAFTVAKGIVEAVDRGARVINLSLGGFGDSDTLRLAVEYALGEGVALVASSGNEGLSTLPYPAQYDGVLAVAAVDAESGHAGFSNQSDAVDVAAPGVGVYAAWGDEQWVAFSGTSAASPLVAGGVAALLSQQEDLLPRQAAELLLANANDTGLPGQDTQTGRGVISLDRALSSGQAGIYDIAVSDIHLSPFVGANGRSLVYVTAQNRGTESIETANLSIESPSGSLQTVYLGRLEPGEVKAHAIEVSAAELEAAAGYRLSASVSAPVEDARPSNDSKSAVLRSR